MSDFDKIMEFIKESEKLKGVERKTSPVGMSRKENSAEHSWSLALMALLMQDLSNDPVDILKVLKMLIIHDLAEINVGDTFVYAKNAGHADDERNAARKLFDILPKKIGHEFFKLWTEFEDKKTPEALYANSLDRFHPCFCNYNNAESGLPTSWKNLGVSSKAALRKNKQIKHGSEVLWNYTEGIINKSQEKGYFPDSKDVKYD